MPLIDVEAPPTSTDAHYVVYFASPENGQSSWCPDCRNALPALQNVFGAESAPSAYVIQAGTRAEWRGNPNNKWRSPPYNVTCLPTIVRVENGKEVARLGDVEGQEESALRKLIA
ncbi:hypothetical protein ACSS6W_005030 [Trichoderma asperelloides]|uniref:Thioredoxin-like protein Clot n=2 Tax=Trichoderma asperellum TaxID=101201 RepID=A0A6V8R6D6_TRIAP|nr:hypothetical protein M441DRAFT_147861 [Trichoderma asperellum CBS 433.97]KAH8122306.1 hypothetical protein LI328DRAFT_136697 [Trichoderma asperelloides]PTB37565.1 hypothetical protein M441DRAFT_147861 [Trichoderma asperellum CBS 433.97]UKZ90548.1 hypothetical protein TrAFT101_005559 [Trichoderma asperellum]GFP59832.1 thioredoxin-like protein Clot [Trichoderma asperellum]